jgi:2-phospho-L-lactate guanylyltransferase (CobY/MobA/RfbA family)
MASQSALILFTLSPETEGRRKSLGLGRPERAAHVFAALLSQLQEVCGGLPGVDLLIATPHRDRVRPAKHAKYLPQRGESFGESLRLAVDDAFSLCYRRVVVIGNDSPEISRDYIEDAFQTLTTSGPRTAVLGPAKDGGYALLGLSTPCPEVFQAMPWGTSRVARLTEARLDACGFAVEKLATLADIDDPRSLARFLTRARTGRLAALARRIAAILLPLAVCQRPTARKSRDIFLTGWLALRAPPGALA